MQRPSKIPIEGDLYTTEAQQSRADSQAQVVADDPEPEAARAAIRQNELCRKHGRLLCPTCRPTEDTTQCQE